MTLLLTFAQGYTSVLIFRLIKENANEPEFQILDAKFFSVLESGGTLGYEIDVFQRKCIMFPIQEGNHWIVGIIFNAETVKSWNDKWYDNCDLIVAVLSLLWIRNGINILKKSNF